MAYEHLDPELVAQAVEWPEDSCAPELSALRATLVRAMIGCLQHGPTSAVACQMVHTIQCIRDLQDPPTERTVGGYKVTSIPTARTDETSPILRVLSLQTGRTLHNLQDLIAAGLEAEEEDHLA